MDGARDRSDGSFGIQFRDFELELIGGRVHLHTARTSAVLTSEQINGIAAVIERHRKEKQGEDDRGRTEGDPAAAQGDDLAGGG
jgi:hypothetical protein